MNILSRPVRCLPVLGLLWVVGCGPSGPPVTPVEGVIKINEAPAGNLLIQFTPTAWPDGTKILSASAVSDQSGRFVLKCDNGQSGAPVGKHKVTVVDNNLAVAEEPKPGSKIIPNRIPLEYASAVSSPLELVVEAGKKDYELKVKARR